MNIIVIPILLVKRSRLREVKCVFLGQTANKWLNFTFFKFLILIEFLGFFCTCFIAGHRKYLLLYSYGRLLDKIGCHFLKRLWICRAIDKYMIKFFYFLQRLLRANLFSYEGETYFECTGNNKNFRWRGESQGQSWLWCQWMPYGITESQAKYSNFTTSILPTLDISVKGC